MSILTDPGLFKLLGITGVLIVVIGATVSAGVYRGKQGQKYSPFNHYISELGELGVSRFAGVFNLSLILAGLALIPASISLGLILSGWLATLGLFAGVASAVSLMLVGVFPMNRIKPHGKAAMMYFRAGLVMILMFNLAIFLQPADAIVLPRLWGLAGLPAVAAFASFLILIYRATKQVEHPLGTADFSRPKFWPMAIVEWLVFITVLLWIILIAMAI